MINARAILVIIFVFFFFFALVIKLFDIQILKSEELKYFAQRQQTKLEKIPAERGMIYDRNNVLLVYNRNDVSFYADLRMLNQQEKEMIAGRFSEVFGNSKTYYMNLLAGSGKTICIEKKASGEKAQILKNFNVDGLFYQEDPTRVYHYENLASHIIGFVDKEYAGINGIEKSFEEDLHGQDGTRLVERNAIGQMLTVEEDATNPATPGNNIILTIDKVYQNILEEELRAGVKQYEASSATGIIMNPNTGEILALSNVNDFDPNKYWEADDDSRRNKALTDTYEPGSTFKSITLAALFDQNLCNEDDLVFAENGKYKFKNVYIRDTHKHEWLTVKGVMEQSSNIGISKLVQKIDDESFYKYLRGFGFGNFTSIDLPGEAKGTLKKPNQWTPITKSFMSFGYELSVTPLQMITAYSAIINGGILYQPQIIKSKTSGGKVVFENEPKQIRSVISPETSERMRKILYSIVEEGTGKNAKLDFISIGGKTGTSQKLIDGKYSSSQHNSSFIGFFPIDNPRLICLVLLNSPKIGKYGGLAAAPIFKNVASRIVLSYPDRYLTPGSIKNKIDQQFAVKQSNRIQIVSNVVQTSVPKITDRSRMPDLINSSVRDALKILNELGIDYKVKGSGRIVSQSILPGEKINKGASCFLVCEEIAVTGATIY